MGFLGILRFYSRSFWLSEFWKSLVTILGMSLGIALFLGIQLANQAALESFRTSAELLQGGADLEVAGELGEVPETLIPKLREIPGLEHIEPISRRLIEVKTSRGLLGTAEVFGVNILGGHGAVQKVDNPNPPSQDQVFQLLKDEGVCWISSELKAQIGDEDLEIRMLGKVLRLKPIYTLPPRKLSGGLRIFLDISRFQDNFQSWGSVDSIQLFLAPQSDKDRIEALVKEKLPEHFGVYRENQNAKHASVMTEAFRLNLQFLSCISLFVAVLLVYNTMSFFVLKRRRDFGILQSIGASPREIRKLLLLEAITLGLLSSILGIILGSATSSLSLHLIQGTLKNIYGQLASEPPQIPWILFFEALILGPGLALLGTLGPSKEVFDVSLKDRFSLQNTEDRFQKKVFHYFFFGLVLCVCALLSSRSELLRIDTRFGFLAPSCAVFAACFLLPWLMIRGLYLFRSLLKNLPLPLLLATDHILSTPRRNSVAAASVMVAFGMGFSLTVMIASFRDTVGNWILGITKADIYISGHFGPGTGVGSPLPEELLTQLANHPGVREVDPISTRPVDLGAQRVRLTGCRMDVIRDQNRLLFQKPMDFAERDQVTRNPETIFISEVLARRSGLRIGDRLEIPGKIHSFQAKVENIFSDFSSDQGVIVLPIETLRSMNGEAPLQGITLYLNAPDESAAFAKQLESELISYQLKIRNNIGLREEVLRIFDETFRITYALQAIALLVSAATLLNTLSMLALERTREFAVLRALGASRTNIVSLVLSESLVLSLIGFIGGVVLGVILSVILVYVVNVHFFGWSIAFHLPASPFLYGGVALVVLSSAIGGFHGRRMLLALKGEILRYE